MKQSEFKKGVEVFEIQIWNFHLNCKRHHPGNWLIERGRNKWVEQPVYEDQIKICRWKVASAGKKRANFENFKTEENRKSSIWFRFHEDTSISNQSLLWHKTEEEAVKMAKQLWRNDKHKRASLDIIIEK